MLSCGISFYEPCLNYGAFAWSWRSSGVRDQIELSLTPSVPRPETYTHSEGIQLRQQYWQPRRSISRREVPCFATDDRIPSCKNSRDIREASRVSWFRIVQCCSVAMPRARQLLQRIHRCERYPLSDVKRPREASGHADIGGAGRAHSVQERLHAGCGPV